MSIQRDVRQTTSNFQLPYLVQIRAKPVVAAYRGSHGRDARRHTLVQADVILLFLQWGGRERITLQQFQQTSAWGAPHLHPGGNLKHGRLLHRKCDLGPQRGDDVELAEAKGLLGFGHKRLWRDGDVACLGEGAPRALHPPAVPVHVLPPRHCVHAAHVRCQDTERVRVLQDRALHGYVISDDGQGRPAESLLLLDRVHHDLVEGEGGGGPC